jgi:hypothetical protein
MREVEELIRAALRGDEPRWPDGASEAFVASFLERSAYHGVQALLHHKFLVEHGKDRAWPERVLGVCRDAATGQAMWELRHREVVRDVLARLSDVGVRPVLFKGTALAYGCYPAPYLRTRGDTDLLVPADAREKTVATLVALGFRSMENFRGDLVSNAAVFRLSRDGAVHELDLHWRISNYQVLSRLFDYAELAASPWRLPSLSPEAIAADRVAAFVLACVHRACHRETPYYVDHVEHFGGDRLIWLYDIYLLLEQYDDADYARLLDVAEKKGVAGICLGAIDEARESLGAPAPVEVCEKLARAGSNEAITRFLTGSALYRYYCNFAAVGGPGNKLRLLAQILFPSEDYMRLIYAGVRPGWLPWLYARRIAIESGKRIRRSIWR